MISSTTLPHYLHISLSPEVLQSFPGTKVAFTLLKAPILPKKSQSKEMQKFLSETKQNAVKSIVDRGISIANYEDLRVCQSWRSVFDTFNAGEDKRSTIESLIQRAADEGQKILAGKKASMGDNSNFVDFYNSISLFTLTPMGATDISKIASNVLDDDTSKTIAKVELRFAKEGESFIPLGRNATEVFLTPTSVVYADQEKILTGFWNWKDSKECCVPPESKKDEQGNPIDEYILLVADQAHEKEANVDLKDQPGDAEEAILASIRDLHKVGGTWFTYEVLSANKSEVTFDLSNIQEGEVKVVSLAPVES